MALIQCPECRKEVLDSFLRCPDCGCLLKKQEKAKSRKASIIAFCAVVALVGIIALVVKIKKDNAEYKKKLEAAFWSTSATEVPQGFVYGESSIVMLAENCSAAISVERSDTSGDDCLFISFNFNGASKAEEEEYIASFLITIFRYFAPAQFDYVSINGKLSDGSFFAAQLSDWNKVKDIDDGNYALLRKAVSIFNGYGTDLAEQKIRAAQYAEKLFAAIEWNGKGKFVKQTPEGLDDLPYLLLG